MKAIHKHVILNVAETMKTIFKRRDFNMRALIFIQLGIYTMCMTAYGEMGIKYLYIVK